MVPSAQTAANETKPVTFRLSEDWTVVVLGFLNILLILWGLTVPAAKLNWTSPGDLAGQVLTTDYLYLLFIHFFLTFFVFLLGNRIMGKPLKGVLLSFPFIFLLTHVAVILAGHRWAGDLNLEAVIFSLVIGLMVNNLFRLPAWFKSTLNSELMVKVGLVILGTSIIFSDILKAGLLGVLQSVIVVVSVWYFSFWICRWLRLDKELSLMLSSAVSICGVSAAIATAGAIQGDNRKLSFVISLVLVTAIPMMIFMPAIAGYLGLPEAVTGAWLGGSIDTTGAVVASGTLVGEEALKISTIVKFSQNVLLGIAALGISVYWSYTQTTTDERPSLNSIWERFPKFILGFLLASLLFSFVISSQTLADVKGSLKTAQNLWFVLAFTSIGLETRFSDIFNADSRKPLLAFLLAQGFNILITLLLAYLLFS